MDGLLSSKSKAITDEWSEYLNDYLNSTDDSGELLPFLNRYLF